MKVITLSYALKDTLSGFFLPQARGGFSHTEPTEFCLPRLFKTKTSARNAATAWERGHWSLDRHLEQEESWEYEVMDFKVTPVARRFSGRLQVVPVLLSELST